MVGVRVRQDDPHEILVAETAFTDVPQYLFVAARQACVDECQAIGIDDQVGVRYDVWD
jgi:hypothetical protein